MASETQSFLPRFSDAADIDEFVSTLERFERGEINAEDFRRYRLARGVYGQRQENTQMIRVKIPQGVVAPAALEALAAVADAHGHGFGHVTTRQNIQFHFVPMAEAEAAMRTLAEAGLTTREACGNTVRNVTTSPFAGVHASDAFDVTPHGEAVTRFFLRKQWANSLPRKFKIALSSGPFDHCMTAIHDVGLTARIVDGQRGFRMTVAGGLSTSPQNAVLFFDFLPEASLLDACEAVVRVFDRAGNRDNKHRARLKYVLRKMGEEKFLATLREEYAAVLARGGTPLDLSVTTAFPPPPARTPEDVTALKAPGYLAWRASNVFSQSQEGYSTVTVRLPLGKITSAQFRALGAISSVFGEGSVRLTVDQNVVLRFVPDAKLAGVHRALVEAGLGAAGARTVADVTSCPGAESCNLAVTSSRALGAAIAERLESDATIADALQQASSATIKISGCPNSCGQHHVADLGFHGAVRKVGDRTAPVYQLHLGGGFDDAGARFGRQVIKIPARRVPEAVARLVTLFAAHKREGESPEGFYKRVAAPLIESALADLAVVDAKSSDETFLDIGQEASFVVAIGAGECAA